MLRHADIWRAIDSLAKAHGLSPSGLARKAGLDPTTFNKSKRFTGAGKARWPSTESVAKILAATGASLGDFTGLIAQDSDAATVQRVQLLGLAQAGRRGFFDDAGYPAGGGWDEIAFPDIGDPNAYALEISGESMEPVYRDGDVVVVSPAASIRRGDRVVVKTTEGEVMIKELKRQTANAVELGSFNPAHADITLDTARIDWMARVLWASQ